MPCALASAHIALISTILSMGLVGVCPKQLGVLIDFLHHIFRVAHIDKMRFDAVAFDNFVYAGDKTAIEVDGNGFIAGIKASGRYPWLRVHC